MCGHPVGRRHTLRLARLRGRHLYRAIGLHATHSDAGRQSKSGQTHLRGSDIQITRLHGRKVGMLAHKGTARTAPERHHRLQLPYQRRENRIQNQLCVCETVCGPAGRHHFVRTQPPRQQQLPRHDRRARHAATIGKCAR